MLSLKPSQIVSALSLILITAWLFWSSKSYNHHTSHALEDTLIPQYTAEEQILVSDLEQYGIVDIEPGTIIQYAKLELTADSSPSSPPPLLQDINAKFPSLHRLHSVTQFEEGAAESARTKFSTIKMGQVPDASNIVFGVATDLHRLNESLHAFTHWASGNGARIVALTSAGSSEEELFAISNRAKALGLDVQIISNPLDFNDRYFALTKALYEHRGAATWAALIDDDTFFPSILSLQKLLSKYDVTQPHYIGALSEDFFQIAVWGLIAYGGAGIFLSMPLLEQMMLKYELCMGVPSTGDKKVAICVLTSTDTVMSHEPQLHQVDLKGDASGFYEALRKQPVSVHHWKSWNRFDMSLVSLVSKVCGDTCIFQKYRLADGWRLTNGISLVKYSYDTDENDIRMEETWNDSRGEDQEEMFRHSLAPLKPKDPNKIQYLMEASSYDERKAQVRQFYVRRNVETLEMNIVEIVWKTYDDNVTN